MLIDESPIPNYKSVSSKRSENEIDLELTQQKRIEEEEIQFSRDLKSNEEGKSNVLPSTDRDRLMAEAADVVLEVKREQSERVSEPKSGLLVPRKRPNLINLRRGSQVNKPL